MKYETINDILRLPEHTGLTQYQVFRKPFKDKIPEDKIQKHYRRFIENNIKGDISAINNWYKEQEELEKRLVIRSNGIKKVFDDLGYHREEESAFPHNGSYDGQH